MPTTEAASPVVLDTHVWLWVMNGQAIESAARASILAAAAVGRVYVPAIAVWEVGMLEARGRIVLHTPAITWVERALAAPGTQLAPLSPQIALESTRLPGDLHGDPSDRIIAATARRLDALLVTRDERLIRYGEQGFLSVVPA